MKRKTIKPKTKEYQPSYADKKTIFASKEIIFRSQGRAKVFNISSRAQVIFLAIVFFAAAWSFYSYHMYNKSGRIIFNKNKQIVETQDAYVELVTDFATLHKNVSSMINSIDKNIKSSNELDRYKKQAMVVEDKIKKITEEKTWVNPEQISEKISLSEAILQRDIVTSERDDLKKQMDEMQSIVKEIKAAEMQVLEKVEQISSKEINKIKGALNSINTPLKKKGLYFNALANSKKKSAQGGTYVPDEKIKVRDQQIKDKISTIFKNVDDLTYYREVVASVPIGKPVWSYWVTSHYGSRSDPFNGRSAQHKGLDLSSRTGNKIKIKARGKVIKAEYSGGYGNLIIVDHGNGFQTKYGHLNKIYVKKGAYLEYDDTIGEVGTTGRSTGPHLHYEVLYQGEDVDPMPFLKAKIS